MSMALHVVPIGSTHPPTHQMGTHGHQMQGHDDENHEDEHRRERERGRERPMVARMQAQTDEARTGG